MLSATVRDWLLAGDPAIRWQVERDLLHEPEAVWGATRARTATEGFGAALLARQDADGQWAGGAYFPADATPDEPGQPWTATTWSLNALREWGVDAAALGDTADRLAAGSRWEYDDLPYWGGEVDCCINGFTLANGAWLGVDVAPLARWFVEHRLADGGWNCEWTEGATASSFHSTLNSIRGLLAWEAATGGTAAVREARRAGEEYLLRRGLLRRLSTGQQVGDWATAFTSPPRWRYSVLGAADHLRLAGLRDPRAAEAVELIRAQRTADGVWLQGEPLPGRTWFEVDVPAGGPSRWITLTATRVLEWWDTDA